MGRVPGVVDPAPVLLFLDVRVDKLLSGARCVDDRDMGVWQQGPHDVADGAARVADLVDDKYTCTAIKQEARVRRQEDHRLLLYLVDAIEVDAEGADRTDGKFACNNCRRYHAATGDGNHGFPGPFLMELAGKRATQAMALRPADENGGNRGRLGQGAFLHVGPKFGQCSGVRKISKSPVKAMPDPLEVLKTAW